MGRKKEEEGMQSSKGGPGVKDQFGDFNSPSVLDREYLLFKKLFILYRQLKCLPFYPKLFRYFMTGKLWNSFL